MGDRRSVGKCKKYQTRFKIKLVPEYMVREKRKKGKIENKLRKKSNKS